MPGAHLTENQMSKKLKRQIRVVNIPDLQTIIDLGDAHAAALIVLANVEVPKDALPYVQKARYLLAETFKSIVQQYEKAAKSPFVIDYIEQAFKTDYLVPALSPTTNAESPYTMDLSEVSNVEG
jgi:hypothetical protein